MAVGNGTTIKNSTWANGGVDWKFTTQPPVTLHAPVLIAPANSSIDQPTTITLQWQDTNSSPQERVYKVRFKVAGGTYTHFSVAANSISFLKTGLANNKTYYWSVQAKGNGSSIKDSPWPPDWKFKTVH